ncbi:MAG: DUF1254 domain-containing protein [Phycisphaerales bacterium]|nr:MAG: DUF1254 domain-containing protein [Phycisphaerales bacterium]
MRTKCNGRTFIIALAVTLALVPTGIAPAEVSRETLESISTPDKVTTRIGTLEFFDGFPTDETVRKVYDNLDFLRGVEVFLNCCPGASLVAMRKGMREIGAVDGTIAIFENFMDSNSLFLTPNTESVYAATWLDLKDGPIVVESPPNVLGIVDDFWFHYVTDLGNAGPDRGKGGKFLFLPPNYKGEKPEGYYVFQSPTYGNILLWRGFAVKGDPKPAVHSMKKHARVYPLTQAGSTPEAKFINVSGRAFNTIHANDFTFYEEVNQLVQEEPNEALDPETLGLLASIGIEKGKPFTPDARMKKTLTEAVAVANATARAALFAPRNRDLYIYPDDPDSHWKTAFIGGSHEFVLEPGVRDLDGRTRFFYYATMVTPAMTRKMVGAGSQYAIGDRDAKGNPLDGSKTYKLTLPPDVPAKDFWSIVVYDNQTRSMLQSTRFPSLNSQRGVPQNADGSFDIYFGPKAPAGKESDWIKTMPGKGWNMLLRLYGPLEPWFDKTWRPGEIELVD